jgi:aryl-alcohol dehydrogenase
VVVLLSLLLTLCPVCHTDISAWSGLFGPMIPSPAVFGHEGSGIVEWLPADYAGPLQVGDKVMASFTRCQACSFCKAGQLSGCHVFTPKNLACYDERMQQQTIKLDSGVDVVVGFFGQSSFASHMPCHFQSLVKVDADTALPPVTAFGCGIITGFSTALSLMPSHTPRSFEQLRSLMSLNGETLQRDGVEADATPQTLAVFGIGCVGAGSLVFASKVSHAVAQRVAVSDAFLQVASKQIPVVIAVDIDDARLALATKLGATHTINSAGLSSDEVAAKVRELSHGGTGATMVVEASGVPACVETGIKALGHRGRLAIVGAPAPGSSIPVDVFNLLNNQQTIRGVSPRAVSVGSRADLFQVMMGDSDPLIILPLLLKLHKQSPWMQHLVQEYKPENMAQALKDAKAGTTIKPVLVW